MITSIVRQKELAKTIQKIWKKAEKIKILKPKNKKMVKNKIQMIKL